MSTWHTLESARDQWADAPLDDESLSELLEVAKVAVLAYAPALPPTDPEDIPVSYRVAQLMQARNVWNSGQANPGGGDGFDNIGYGLTTKHPLDWQIKQLLRPRSVFGGVVG